MRTVINGGRRTTERADKSGRPINTRKQVTLNSVAPASSHTRKPTNLLPSTAAVSAGHRILVKHSALLSPEVVESQAIIAGLVCSSQIPLSPPLRKTMSGKLRSPGKVKGEAPAPAKAEEEFEVEEVKDRIEGSLGIQLALVKRELGLNVEAAAAKRRFSRERIVGEISGCCLGYIIHPDNKLYRAWTYFILVWALYSSFFTPLEFGFFRGLPENLLLLDVAGQIAFLVDVVFQFFVAYKDDQTYKMVHKRSLIALRYLKSSFLIDLLGCMPWDAIYKASGKREGVRYLLWIRLWRVRRVEIFFQKMEKDIRINYLFTRIVKLLFVELYCTHTAACIFYYLATTLPRSHEGYTWIGSLKLGDYSYAGFREIDFYTRYITSLYFAIVTMATVGYGDIHAVNVREMIFIMMYVSFDMILGAYLLGNMTALIVKGSKTERFRDKMTDLIKYMNRNKLEREIRDQIKGHVRLQYESSYSEAAVLQDIPISIRAKVSQNLYKPVIEKVPLFKGCTPEFINQIAIRLHEELFLPGEVIMEQGLAVDQIYFVCHGLLEEITVAEDGSEENLSSLERHSTFGEIAILCNIPQPYTVRVRDLCRLLRLDKQSFTNVLQIYFFDGRTVLNNLLERKESNVLIKQLESDISFHIGKQEADLALKLNSAAYHGDLYHLKGLISAGADPSKVDYDGRSPLHLAASQGNEDIVQFLIEKGVNTNSPDKLGNTPLLEAIKNGHDSIASILVKEGASLSLDGDGSRLCMAVAKGEHDMLKRLLSYGADPNIRDYYHRTPLHIAAADGLYLMAKLLVDSGASVLLKDRWGRTALDEARMCGSKTVIKLLEDAKTSQNYYSADSPPTPADAHKKKCTVFPFHPWGPKEERKEGVVLWVPRTVAQLINLAEEQLHCSCSAIMSEDGGKITDVGLISDGQKLYMIIIDDTG